MNFFILIDHITSKIKKSSCFGNSIEFKNDELKKTNSNTNSSFENLKKEIYEMIQNKDKDKNKENENNKDNKDNNILDKV